MHDDADGHGKPSGCGWYRIVMPMTALAGHGHDTWHGPPQKFTSERRAYPLIVSQRMDKYDALGDWRRLATPGRRLVYEIDDDVFNVTIENWMAYRIYSRPEVQEAVAVSAGIADMVTVTTEPLAEVMRKFSRNVRVLPNCVPDEIASFPAPWEQDRPGVTIGWTGGASHARDLAMIATPLRHVLERNPAASLHILGTDFRPTIGAAEDRMRFTEWIASDVTLAYYWALTAFDIGLAPLTGTTFDMSKSAIKALEYAALGIPVIASDCEPYRAFVADGVNGYLIRRKGDWAKRIAELVNDPDARHAMGAKGREMVTAGHTIGTGWRAWADAYESLT